MQNHEQLDIHYQSYILQVVLLRGISRDEVERGQVLAKPGSVTPHHKFKASV